MSFLERMKQKLAQTVEDGTMLAEPEVTEARLAICEKCPSIRKPRMQCAECGCLMPAKTRLKGASCPLGKW